MDPKINLWAKMECTLILPFTNEVLLLEHQDFFPSNFNNRANNSHNLSNKLSSSRNRSSNRLSRWPNTHLRARFSSSKDHS